MAAPYAIVNIWMKGRLNHFLGAGHGSLKIMTPEGRKYYITWVGEASGFKQGFAATFGSIGCKVPDEMGFEKVNIPGYGPAISPWSVEHYPQRRRAVTYKSDKMAYRNAFGHTAKVDPESGDQLPESSDYKLRIPVKHPLPINADENFFGIDVYAVEHWWLQWLRMAPNSRQRYYAMLSKTNNCDGVTYQALQAGGLDLFAKMGTNFIYQGARYLRNYVQAAIERIDKLNAMRAELIGQLRTATATGALFREDAKIPELDAWKQLSYVGVFARRKEQVAAIDRLLPLYHRHKNANEEAEAFKVLLRIFENVCDHLVKKPKSDRRRAVMILGVHVLGVLERDYYPRRGYERLELGWNGWKI
jgi:hypothetical protein